MATNCDLAPQGMRQNCLDSQVHDLVGTITNPVTAYNGISSIGLLLSNILRLVFIGAGIFALFNLITAGFQYMNSGGDSKQLVAAWNRIWLTLFGLIIIVGSFAFAALIGYVFFGNPTYILQPMLYGAPTK